jgi:hypothetical protein
MKKIIWFIIVSIFTFICTSCDKSNIVMNREFNVSIETEFQKINLLSNIYQIEYLDSTLTSAINLTPDERKAIFNFIIKNEFFELPDYYEPFCFDLSLPKVYTKIEINNGNVKKVIYFSNSNYSIINTKKVNSFREFVKVIESICKKRESIMKMPNSNIIKE